MNSEEIKSKIFDLVSDLIKSKTSCRDNLDDLDEIIEEIENQRAEVYSWIMHGEE